MFSYLDRWAIAAFGEKFNPFARMGALAVTSILVAVATGILLLPFYSTSVHEAYSSVSWMLTNHPLTLGILHSVHRYSSDAAMLFTILHLFRIFASRAFFRSRVLSWETGLVAMGLLWFVGWTGYWLVWDQTAFHVAQMSARMLDLIPIFGTFLENGLLLNDSINNQLFFVVFFIHMIIPIGLFALLWIHVSRVNRPKFLVDKKNAWGLLGVLILFAALYPGQINEHADPLSITHQLYGDFFYIFPIQIFQNLTALQTWLAFLGAFAVAAAVPWILREKPLAPSKVDDSRCTGCGNCFTDCPYQAIDMLKRTDGSKHELVAWVDPAKCMSCGICSGACDSDGNNLPWLSIDEVHARIDRWSSDTSRKHLLFICRDVLDGKWKLNAEGILEVLPGYRIMEVPCAGLVNPKSLKRAYEKGFESIMIASSLPGACVYREGNQFISERVSGQRKPSGRMGTKDRARTFVLNFGKHQQSEIISKALQIANGVSP